MVTPTPSTWGQHLLQIARDNGLTSQDLADILGLPVHIINLLEHPNDLDEHRLRAVRVLAERLGLSWPDWLTGPHDPSPAEPAEQPRDPLVLQTVLTHLLGIPVHLSQAADILHWTIPRTRAAADQLADRIATTPGFQLDDTGDTLTLTTGPRLLGARARARIHQLRHDHLDTPTPLVYLVIYRATEDEGDKLHRLVDHAPDALDHAAAAGYLTYRIHDYGEPAGIALTPETAYNLGITDTPPDGH